MGCVCGKKTASKIHSVEVEKRGDASDGKSSNQSKEIQLVPLENENMNRSRRNSRQHQICSRFEELVDFVKMSSLLITSIDLDSVILIPRKEFLSLDKMEPHESIQKMLTSAAKIRKALEKGNKRVLFVSHRWGAADFPDDSANNQFTVICDYICAHSEIDYIWLDYSSISQVKGEELFWKHLENIPTSLYTATDMLVIPRIDQATNRTDLTDYLGRCWCILESFIALVTKTNLVVYFQDGAQRMFIPIDLQRGETYHSAVSTALQNVQSNFYPQWVVGKRDPAKIIAKVQNDIDNILASNDDQQIRIIRQCLRMRLRFNLDPKSSYPLIKEVESLKVWKCLGNAAVESDKAIVLNLMIYVMLYVDGFLSSGKSSREIVNLTGDLQTKTALTVHNKFLSPTHFMQILRHVGEKDHKLEELHIVKNFTCGANITGFLQKNPSVRSISLKFEGIHSDSDIFNALKANAPLTKLDLTGNPGIGNDGAEKIAQYLKINRTLTKLVLNEVHLKNRGAFAIANVLTSNPTLEILSLSKNKFGDKGALALVEKATRSTLKQLNLTGNSNVRDKDGKISEVIDAASSSCSCSFFMGSLNRSPSPVNPIA